jgi:hypothetical protein
MAKSEKSEAAGQEAAEELLSPLQLLEPPAAFASESWRGAMGETGLRLIAEVALWARRESEGG